VQARGEGGGVEEGLGGQPRDERVLGFGGVCDRVERQGKHADRDERVHLGVGPMEDRPEGSQRGAAGYFRTAP